MRTFVILAAGALLLAATIVEIPSRLWPDNALALLAVAFVALLAQGWLGSRLLSKAGGDAAQPASRPAKAARSPAGSGKTNKPARSERLDRPTKVSSGAVGDGSRESGTVKWFNRSKGFGFIVRASGDEIFVHQRSIRGDDEKSEQRRPTLRDGQAVSFVVIERDKGLQAEDVTPES